MMDVEMPDMDGLETTRRIRDLEKSKKAKPIPIIAMTAHTMVGDRERCISAGMDDYISKPLHITYLTKKEPSKNERLFLLIMISFQAVNISQLLYKMPKA